MENKLTSQVQVPYSVIGNMDNNIEKIQNPQGFTESRVPKKQSDDLELTTNGITAPKALQEEAKRRWEDDIKKREERGERISDHEKKLIQAQWERGVSPVGGGSGDDKYEHFNADLFKGTRLEEIARELKRAGQNNQVTDELKERATAEALRVGGMGGEDEADAFAKEFSRLNQPREEVDREESQSHITPEAIQQRLDQFSRQKERSSNNPRSVQELAMSIIRDEGEDRWGKGGIFPLLREDNSINQENFIRWTRERLMYHHLSNSRDYQLQMYRLVGVDNAFGNTINIFDMDKNRQQYFYDLKSGEVLDGLADVLKTEVWLFGSMRNYDLLYQEYMASDTKLPDFLNQVHNKEELISPGSLKHILTMAQNYDENGNGLDTKIGDGVRKAYEVYYYLSDLPMLERLLGKDSVFFKKEGFINAFTILEKKKPGEALSSDAQVFIDTVFPNGVMNKGEFMKQMNIFNEQNKPEFNKALSREMVRQAIAEKYSLEYGLNKSTESTHNNKGELVAPERDFLRKDLEYAEAWAWVLTRFTGAAARNDTDAIGFDAFTKTMNVRNYRARQSASSRAGQFGNEYDMGVYKAVTMDFFNGITVEKRKGDKGNITPFEIFRGMSAVEDDTSISKEEREKKKKLLADRLNFEQFTQKGYASNHVGRAFEVFHSLLGAEELRLDDVVKWDPMRGVIIDRAKFEENVKEKFLKPGRYAFSTYGMLDFGKTTRVFKKKDKDVPIYEEKTIAEAFFGPEVTAGIKEDMVKDWRKSINADIAKGKQKEKLTEQEQKIMNFDKFEGEEQEQLWRAYLSTVGRSKLWKRAAMARIALDMKSHREYGNGYSPFSEAMIEKFYMALESIKQVDVDEQDDHTDLSYGGRFFTEEDIDWIRKHSKTTRRELFIKDIVIKEAGMGLAKGIFKGASEFVEGIFK